MFTAESVISKLKADKQILKDLHLSGIGLFGSAARGDNSDKSDLDFLVDYVTGFKNLKNLMKVVDYLEENFGSNIDVVTKESLTPYFYSCIIKDIKYVRID